LYFFGDGGQQETRPMKLGENEIYSSICYYLMEFEKLERNVMKQMGVPRNKWKPPLWTFTKPTLMGLSIRVTDQGVGDLL